MPLVVKYLVLTASHNNARVRVVAEEKLQKFLKVQILFFKFFTDFYLLLFRSNINFFN
jgi:hypothetical protein